MKSVLFSPDHIHLTFLAALLLTPLSALPADDAPQETFSVREDFGPESPAPPEQAAG
ncbi:MAG: hypothetical protein KDN20_05075 [Verrucomicrobiae bacterium]|nr:hypothetical protein [Verrucomicrobiae bacterium]